jgi:hypothetical protein
MIDGFVSLVAENTRGIILDVMVQQPITSPIAIKKCEPDKKLTARGGSGLVEDVGTRHATLSMEEGLVSRTGGVLLVQRPLTDKMIWSAIYQLNILQMMLELNILFQCRHVKHANYVPDPEVIAKGVMH